ncbi:hypothetical protein [Clostridium tetani]|uniref:hypothetical protein n=1 Tax=Clostridium tetani TaxID=1513 RepID=UPI00100C06D7|nr:hypothetical protein [Clostridium tetani]RXM69432.1 hypothetical protein DP139_10350 [Clostridium tetani]
MATISASLRMFDQMTRPLQQVTQALNLTISAMDNMNNSANRDIRITNSLNTARGAIQRASVGLQELASSQDRARNNQDRLNNSFNKGKNVADGLLNKVKGLASAYLGFQAIKKGIDLTIVGAANLEQQLITISGMLGNKDVGKAFFEKINDYALISQYGLKNFAAISRQFIQFTKNTDKLMELNKLAERLAFLDPTQGLEGAGFALKEILGGDGMSLKGRFGFGSGEIKQLKEATSMDDFIKKFDHMVSEKGGTQKAVEEAANAASSLWNNLMANISTSFAKAGNRALEVMKPALRALNEAFREGKFQPFFDSISSGLAIIGQGVLFVLNIISWIGGFVQENWSIIEPILIATALYFSTILIPILWDTITTILAMGVAWLMINWPILLIIGLIALFIYILTQCGVTAEQILGFIGGIFGVTFAFIHNHIAYLWNKFASFAEFIANLFIDPVYAIKKLFYDMATNILGRIANIAKALTDLINMIPGVKVNLHSGLDNLINKIPVPKSDKNVVKIPRMKQLDYENEFKYGYGKGAGVANGIGNMFSTPDLSNISKKANLDEWNKAQGPGKLASEADKDKKKHLKSIDDKIDVSNEHLEMLRDLAEQESIQNFVTLTPTVQVTTGDIKEEADINKIIDKIESYMENELVNSAEGVYA